MFLMSNPIDNLTMIDVKFSADTYARGKIELTVWINVIWSKLYGNFNFINKLWPVCDQLHCFELSPKQTQTVIVQ